MTRMVLVRLALTAPILLGVSMVAFALMRMLPGDFAEAAAGTTSVSPEVLAATRRDLGLDRPIWEQYLVWLGRALVGDLGLSFATRRPVTAELLPRLAVTAQLTAIAGVIALVIGVTTGLLSARLRGRADWIVRGWNSLLRPWRVPSLALAVAAGFVPRRNHRPGPSSFQRELSLTWPWPRHMAPTCVAGPRDDHDETALAATAVSCAHGA